MTCFPVYEWLSPDDAQHWPHDVFEAKAPWRSCRMAVRGSWGAGGSRPVTVKASPDQVVELVESWVTAKNQTHNAVLEKRVEKDSAYLHARCVTPVSHLAGPGRHEALLSQRSGLICSLKLRTALCHPQTVGFADDLFVRTTELNQGTLVEVGTPAMTGGLAGALRERR